MKRSHDNHLTGRVRLMFQDEAGFGRISRPKSCWVPGNIRPSVPCHHIREYRYAFGGVDPLDGESFFIVAPQCNSAWMTVFLEELSAFYPEDHIILVMDNAAWHCSHSVAIPDNIELAFIPPYTPEMNPIEQIWKELRKSFANRLFPTLEKVIDHLCLSMNQLTNETVKSITGRDWILGMF